MDQDKSTPTTPPVKYEIDDVVVVDGYIMTVKRTTAKAVLFDITVGETTRPIFGVWLPKSVFEVIDTEQKESSKRIYCEDLPKWVVDKIKT